MLGTDSGPLEQQCLPFTTEPPLQPFFAFKLYYIYLLCLSVYICECLCIGMYVGCTYYSVQREVRGHMSPRGGLRFSGSAAVSEPSLQPQPHFLSPRRTGFSPQHKWPPEFLHLVYNSLTAHFQLLKAGSHSAGQGSECASEPSVTSQLSFQPSY